MTRSRLRDVLPAPRHLLLLALIVVAEFAVLEAGLRLRGGTEASVAFQSLFMQDPRVGHRPSPGARTHYATVEFATDLAINGQGVRDDQEIGPKAPDERRVILLGDSLVLSVQVPFSQTFGERLEAHLNRVHPDRRWRVINAGVQGYGPVQEWFFFHHVLADLEPDLVLPVVFVGNDAVESHDQEAWLDRGGPPAAAAADAGTLVRRVVRSSLVLQFARLRYDQLRARFESGAPERPLASYSADPPADVVNGLEVSRRAFGMIAERATGIGARTGLVLMPARFQTDDGDYGRLREIVAASGGTLVRNAASERFREALAPLGLPMLDLLPVLEAEPNRIELFFQRNIHLTPRGHEVVGRALFEFLERSGLAEAVR